MALDKNIVKLAAVAVVGSVAKALFEEARPVTNIRYDAPAKPDNTEKDNV